MLHHYHLKARLQMEGEHDVLKQENDRGTGQAVATVLGQYPHTLESLGATPVAVGDAGLWWSHLVRCGHAHGASETKRSSNL